MNKVITGPRHPVITDQPSVRTHLEKMLESYRQLAADYEYASGAGDTHPAHQEMIDRTEAMLRELDGLKARWQAEALESCENIAETEFMPYLGREDQVVLMDDILKVADELRRQAEGAEYE